MHLVFRALPGLALALLLAMPHIASASPSTPTNFQGSYDGTTKITSLSWSAVTSGSSDFVYLVWRDGIYLGQTAATTYSETPSPALPDPGLVYFVSAAPPGNPDNVGLPAVVGVPTLTCEVVNISTSWDYPYLHVHLHQECLGVPYDKDVTWTAP